VAAVALVVVGLTACDGGNDADGLGQSTIALRPTNYVTQPPVTTTSTLPGVTIAAGDVAGQEQTYTVQSGDALPLIADRYNVSVDDLVSYNGWGSANHLIIPGQEIKLPPNAQVPDNEDDEQDSGGDPLGTMPEPNGAPLCPDGTQREIYEVRSGDFISRVADRVDLTVDELEAANEGNPIWSSFLVGENLWLPCEGEDLDDTSASTDSSPSEG
jgi:LysM repeat protein